MTIPNGPFGPHLPRRTSPAAPSRRPPSSSHSVSFLPSPGQVMKRDNTTLSADHTPPMPPRFHAIQSRDGPGCSLRERGCVGSWGPRPAHLGHPPRTSNQHLQSWTPTTPQAQVVQPRRVGIPPNAPLSFLRPHQLRTSQQSSWVGRLPRGGPRPWTLEVPARVPPHLRGEGPRPFHHMTEPGLRRSPRICLSQLWPSVDPNQDEHIHGESPENPALASTHAVLLPSRPPLVMHARYPLGTSHVASGLRIHPKPRRPRHMLMDRNLPPFGTSRGRLGAGHDHRKPHGPDPPQPQRLHNANKSSAKPLKATGLTNAALGLTCEKNDLPLRPLKGAGVVKLVDTPDLGSGASAWGFESLHPHTFRKP